MKYRFLPDIATADLAYEAFGRDYDELFENAGLVLESAMVDVESLEAKDVKTFKLEGKTSEDLLHSFLEELVFLKDAEQLLFNEILCKVNEGNKQWFLEGTLAGEKIDRNKHKLGVDVKAVTKHLFKIEKLRDKTLRCQVILDV